MGIIDDQNSTGNMQRDKKVEIYFTNEEYSHLDDIAKKLNTDVPALLRNVSTGIDKKAYLNGKRFEAIKGFVNYLKSDPLFKNYEYEE